MVFTEDEVAIKFFCEKRNLASSLDHYLQIKIIF